jgi:hypothetical protein
MRHTGRGGAVAVIVALAMLSVAGCGGGGGESTLSKADFIRQADAICGATTARLDNLAGPSDAATPHETVGELEQSVAIIEPALNRLAALRAAPADRAVLAQNLIDPTKAQDLAAQSAISNVQEARGDAATEVAALTAFGDASVDPDQANHDKALADFGFTTCAQTNGGDAAPPTTTTTTPPRAPFVAADAGFSAVFPINPTRQTLVITGSGQKTTTLIYRAVTAGENVSVSYVSLAGTPPSGAIQSVLDNSIEDGASNLKGIVASSDQIAYRDWPAEDAIIIAPGHVVYTRVVIIGSKVYVLEVVTDAADTPHPGYRELLATFTASGPSQLR